MKRIPAYILALILTSLALHAQGSASESEQLFFDALTFAGSTPDSSRLDLIVAIPYSLLGFERESGIFTGRYRLRLNIQQGRTTWYDSSFTRMVTTRSYETSNGLRPAYEFYQQTLSVPPGEYQATVELFDLVANRVATARRELTAIDRKQRKFSLSDPMLVAKIREDSTGHVITPMLTRNINANDGGYFIFFEAYNQTADTQFVVKPRFLKEGKPINFEGARFERVIPEGRSQQWIHLPDTGLTAGNYIVRLEVTSVSDTARILATSDHELVAGGTLNGVPATSAELEGRLSQLVYVANQSEIDRIRNAGSFTEQRRIYAEFWNRLDPTPGTVINEAMQEYFRRIDYATSNFRSYAAGWLTDKGRVYVIYGPPDMTSTDPFRSDGKAVETWQYYGRNLRLVYVDESGFGDFRLVTRIPPGEKYKYGD
jgi:GWxTD domain-containing protein